MAADPARELPPIYVTQPELPPLGELVPLLEEIWERRVLTNSGPLHERFRHAVGAVRPWNVQPRRRRPVLVRGCGSSRHHASKHAAKFAMADEHGGVRGCGRAGPEGYRERALGPCTRDAALRVKKVQVMTG